MNYREMGKTGDKVSVLGYGCMRFPKKDGKIDEERTEKQVISAIERGVNYFDTAYIYPHSEEVLGRILAKGHRDKVLIATKMPLFMIHSAKDMENTLATSLKRLQTDHIDYYLLHNINSVEGWQRLKSLGVIEFLEEKQREGKIRRIGFSYHGAEGQFKSVVDDYNWDFCQIQYNYLDEHTQAGKAGLEYAAKKGLGVVIMEPLRGGLLAQKMPKAAQEIWAECEDGKSKTPAEWALRWVWNHPEVTLLLSGMNEETHIEENLRIAETALPLSLTEQELANIDRVRDTIQSILKVGCTGCGYCMPCPAGVNIPLCFAFYNNKYLFDDKNTNFQYLGFTIGADGGKPSYASLCKDCGKCEKHCPQHLPIRRHLKEVAGDLEGFYFRPLGGMIHGYYRVRGMFRGKTKTKVSE